MPTTRRVLMLLILSAATLITAAALLQTYGVIVFLAGFAAGWATSALVHRQSRRRDAASAR